MSDIIYTDFAMSFDEQLLEDEEYPSRDREEHYIFEENAVQTIPTPEHFMFNTMGGLVLLIFIAVLLAVIILQKVPKMIETATSWFNGSIKEKEKDMKNTSRIPKEELVSQLSEAKLAQIDEILQDLDVIVLRSETNPYYIKAKEKIEALENKTQRKLGKLRLDEFMKRRTKGTGFYKMMIWVTKILGYFIYISTIILLFLFFLYILEQFFYLF